MNYIEEGFELLKEISFERLVGTEGEKKAQEIITKYLKNNNLSFYLEPFSLTGFEKGKASLRFNNKEINGYPNGGIGDVTLEGELFVLESDKQLNENPEIVKDKIVLINFPLDIKNYETLSKNLPKAVIRFSPPDKLPYHPSFRQTFFKEGTLLPVINITYEDAEKLSFASKVSITAHSLKKIVTAENIIIDIKGRDNRKDKIILCAHYDSVATSPGAADNGGGSAILYSIALYLKDFMPRNNFRLIFFSGEELGLLGSIYHTLKHRKETNEIKLVVNIDVAGDRWGKNLAMVLGDDELFHLVQTEANYLGIDFNVKKSIYSSDGMPFSAYSIPSVSLARHGGRPSAYVHTAKDSIEYSSIEGLRDIYKLAKQLVTRIDEAKFSLFKRQIPDELKKEINSYFIDRLGEKTFIKDRDSFFRRNK